MCFGIFSQVRGSILNYLVKNSIAFLKMQGAGCCSVAPFMSFLLGSDAFVADAGEEMQTSESPSSYFLTLSYSVLKVFLLLMLFQLAVEFLSSPLLLFSWPTPYAL